jgi:hypothetical protein
MQAASGGACIMTSKTKIAEYKRPMSELIRTAKALDAKIKQ